MHYILDACALITLFQREQGMEKVRALLDEALTRQITIYMHTINLIEVHYGFYRALGLEKSNLILDQVYTMPIQFINAIDTVIFNEASRLKAQYAISLGDSVGLATAIKLDGVFITADHHELEAIAEKKPLKFFWFR